MIKCTKILGNKLTNYGTLLQKLKMVCPDFFTRADSTTKVAILAFMRKANCISFNLGSVTNLQNDVTQAVAP